MATAGVVAKLRDSVDVMALANDVARGWPAVILKNPVASHFPHGSIIGGGGHVRRPGFESRRVQLDWWVWPTGDNGGWDRVDALDEASKAALDEQHWVHGGLLYYCVALSPNELPAGAGSPLRGSRDYEVHTSPAGAG